jgi:flavin-dependent dehydrogenase
MSVYAHFRRDPAGDTLDSEYTRLVRAPDRWFWLIPLGPELVSVGVVMDAQLFRNLRASPEEILQRSVANTPGVRSSLGNASRITEVQATGDYSSRSRRFTGDRWTLAGDAAGFIDPVFSTGVMLALEASRSATRAIDLQLRDPQRGEAALKNYEKRQIRMMNIYLRIVRKWYEPELVEGLLSTDPFNFFVPAINSVLAGNVPPRIGVRLRIEMFFWLLALQRRWPIFERLPRVENYLAYQTTS